ncbi:MAG: quinone-dependent dihydroorotate dehydrogenase [Bacteroidales bacterium]
MYKLLIRPLLFYFQPETIHHFVGSALKMGFKIPFVKPLVTSVLKVKHPSLERTVFGIKFENPVGIAAGFDKKANLYDELYSMGFSHVEIGTITPKPQDGNPQPRSFRIPQDKGLINRMGFNNYGCEHAKKSLKQKKSKVIIGGNIGKNTLTPNELALQDYETTFRGLFSSVDYFVVNVSCPNVTNLRELQDQEKLFAILSRLQDINNKEMPKRKPILLKVSPDLNTKQLDEVITLVKRTQIDGVVATNTTVSRNGLNTNSSRIEQIGNGGMSGAPIRERSTEVIRYLAEKSNKGFAIIGVGGIFTAKDAIEKLEAGADLIQVYTGFIYEGPVIARKINKAILKNISNQ